jgi:hypothetical protein
VVESEIQLSYLNSSGNKTRSPLKNKIKNRRYIRQGWDMQNIAAKNLTTTNSNYKKMVNDANGKIDHKEIRIL